MVPEDKVAPTLAKTEIDGEKKVVTLTFSEPIERQVGSEEELKAAITFAANGSKFSALAKEDTVEISGKTLKVTFNSPISGETNKIKINAAALKDAAKNQTEEITTEAINANEV